MRDDDDDQQQLKIELLSQWKLEAESRKNLKIFQKTEYLSKNWKSSKNLKIFQKSENVSNIWKCSKDLSDQMSQSSQVSRVTLYCCEDSDC